MAQFVEYEVVEGVAEITMNRGPVNAINMQLAREVVDAYHRARHDDQARAVILTSALPTVFSAGVDLKVALDYDGQQLRRLIEVFYYEMHEALYRMGKPVIAAVGGGARPGKLNYATGNPAGIVAMGQILALSKVDMVQIPYKGEPAGMADLVANRVQLMIGTPTTAGQYVAQGKLRMLATTLPSRSPAYPDVPTMEEAGVRGFSVASWAALQGPAGMPADIVQRLSDAMAEVLKRQDVLAQLSRQNFLPASSTPQELQAFIEEQLQTYAKTLKEAGVQPE